MNDNMPIFLIQSNMSINGVFILFYPPGTHQWKSAQINLLIGAAAWHHGYSKSVVKVGRISRDATAKLNRIFGRFKRIFRIKMSSHISLRFLMQRLPIKLKHWISNVDVIARMRMVMFGQPVWRLREPFWFHCAMHIRACVRAFGYEVHNILQGKTRYSSLLKWDVFSQVIHSINLVMVDIRISVCQCLENNNRLN